MEKRIKAFKKAVIIVHEVLDAVEEESLTGAGKQLYNEMNSSYLRNPWFVKENVVSAFREIASMLDEDSLNSWLSGYNPDSFEPVKIKTVGVIMAGNIPFVGFHDMLCVLLSGHKFLGKLSSNDKFLPVCFANILCEVEPRFKELIVFSDATISGFDAIIATGSNNSARYFEYYFGRYPNIIRKNRNSIAILSGDETADDLKNLADDVFLYFGLGCRNVSMIMIPEGYDFEYMLRYFENYSHLRDHHKYYNNYEYQKAVILVNGIHHLDNGFLLLKEEKNLSSPIAMLFYQYYKDIEQVKDFLANMNGQIQCVVSTMKESVSGISWVLPGEAQKPKPSDFADGIDTLKFLFSL